MKLQVNKKKIGSLVFPWDYKAPSPSEIRKRACFNFNNQRSLVDYFDFLTEIKPYRQELKKITIFARPFTLP